VTLVAVDSRAFRKTYAGRIARRGVAVRAASGVAAGNRAGAGNRAATTGDSTCRLPVASVGPSAVVGLVGSARPGVVAAGRGGSRCGRSSCGRVAHFGSEDGLDKTVGRPMTPLAASTFVWVFILSPLIVVWVIGVVDIARRPLRRSATAAWIVRRYARLPPIAQADATGARTPAGGGRRCASRRRPS
jgi:hypothetical protein